MTMVRNRSKTRGALFAAMVLVGAGCASAATDPGDNAVMDPTAAPTVVAASATPSTAPTAEPTTSTAEPTTSTASPAAATATPVVEQPALAWRTVEFVDTSRPSAARLAADGDELVEGGESRSIPTVILYPGTDGGGPDAPAAHAPPRPLALYLKGLGGSNGPADPLLVTLAEAGYIVAAPNIGEVSDPDIHFPGYVEQPGDARFVIDALTDPDDGFADDLAPLIDPLRIGLVGHSLGATGAFGLAYHECCRDDRVDAVLAFGPNPNFGLGDTDFEFAGAPLLLVYGTADQIAPIALGAAILDTGTGPSHLLTLPDADHFQPVYGDHQGDRTAAIAAAIGVAFLDVHVAGTISEQEFDDLTSSLEPGMWRTSDT